METKDNFGVEFSPDEEAVLKDQGENSPPEATTEQAAEVKADEKPEAKEQPRDESGKFTTKEEEKADKPEDKEEPERKVPLAALHEERERRKELQQRLDREAEERAKLSAKLEILAQKFNKPEEQPKPIDVESDPVAALKETRQAVDQLTQLQQQDVRERQFVQHVGALTSQYAQSTPDYTAAYAHAVNTRVAELRALGHNDMEIPQILHRDEMAIAARALQMGRNPGELIYAYAESRGYKKAEETKAEQRQDKPSAAQKLDTIERGQAASKSLGNAGGAPDSQLTLERIGEMTEQEISKLSRDDMRKLFGA